MEEGGGGGGGGAGEAAENIDDSLLNTVFCRFGSKVKVITSEFGCSYVAVGKFKLVATNKQIYVRGQQKVHDLKKIIDYKW